MSALSGALVVSKLAAISAAVRRDHCELPFGVKTIFSILTGCE